MDPVAGLLQPDDRRRSRNLGLLAAGLQLMGDSGWSSQPQDTLSNVARAGLTGLQAYTGANDRALEVQEFRKAQMAQQAQERAIAEQEARMRAIAEHLAGREEYTPTQQAALGVVAQTNPSAVIDRFVAEAFPERDVRVVGDNLVDANTGNAVYEKGPDPILPTTAEERFAYRKAGIPIGTPADQLTPEQNAAIAAGQAEFTSLRAPTTTVSIAGPDGERQFNLVADALQEGKVQATTAAKELTQIEDALSVLDEGNVNLGASANLQQNVQSWLADAGLIDGERVANTEQLLMTLRSRALNFIQSFPGQLSERELEAAQFLAGDITMTPQGLRRALESARIISRFQISNHNREVEDIWSDNPQLRRFLQVNPGAYGAGGSVPPWER